MSWRCSPIASIIDVSNFPARPTNGSPCISSSRPGPSPTKTSFAFGLPSAKTILFRPLCSLHRVQSPMSSRIFSSESPEIFSLASNSPDFGAGNTIFGGAGTCNAGSGGNTGFRDVLGNVSSKAGDSSTEDSETANVSTVSEYSTTETEAEITLSGWTADNSGGDEDALAERLR